MYAIKRVEFGNKSRIVSTIIESEYEAAQELRKVKNENQAHRDQFKVVKLLDWIE